VRQTLYSTPKKSSRLRDAMLDAPKLSAVIHQYEYGLIIELSDGRMRSVARAQCDPGQAAIQAAVQWAKRRGATSVVIHD
jgi:hypothetical protein